MGRQKICAFVLTGNQNWTPTKHVRRTYCIWCYWRLHFFFKTKLKNFIYPQFLSPLSQFFNQNYFLSDDVKCMFHMNKEICRNKHVTMVCLRGSPQFFHLLSLIWWMVKVNHKKKVKIKKKTKKQISFVETDGFMVLEIRAKIYMMSKENCWDIKSPQFYHLHHH